MPTPTPPPALEVRHHPDRTVLRFLGCDVLDEYNGSVVHQQLVHLPDSLTASHLVLDLDGICLITSFVLGALATFNRRVRAAGGRLVLTNACPFVQEALAITCLDQVMEVVPAGGQPA